MYYPDELIEEVRLKNDIVDVVSGYVKIQKREAAILGFVPFTMKNPLPFLSLPASRCFTALAVGQEAMCLRL